MKKTFKPFVKNKILMLVLPWNSDFTERQCKLDAAFKESNELGVEKLELNYNRCQFNISRHLKSENQ